MSTWVSPIPKVIYGRDVLKVNIKFKKINTAGKHQVDIFKAM
jgi:hypothetical protein